VEDVRTRIERWGGICMSLILLDLREVYERQRHFRSVHSISPASIKGILIGICVGVVGLVVVGLFEVMFLRYDGISDPTFYANLLLPR